MEKNRLEVLKGYYGTWISEEIDDIEFKKVIYIIRFDKSMSIKDEQIYLNCSIKINEGNELKDFLLPVYWINDQLHTNFNKFPWGCFRLLSNNHMVIFDSEYGSHEPKIILKLRNLAKN